MIHKLNKNKMLKNELRINNIISTSFMNQTPTGFKKEWNVCEVKAIGIEKIIVNEKIGKNVLEKHDYSNIKPVVLDDHWLNQLGFELVTVNKYKRYQINLLDTTIYLRPSSDKWYFGFINNDEDCEINDCYELEYVHEIQNLIFSLTKISLTVK